MSRLKSLGLAGARMATSRAFRKLLRLPLPADDVDDPAGTSKETGTETEKSSSSSAAPAAASAATATAASTTALTAEIPSSNTTAADPTTVAPDAMTSTKPAAGQPRQSQSQLQLQQLQEDKENQPPAPRVDALAAPVPAAASDGLEASFADLELGPKPPACEVTDDPVVLAERAHHMRFIVEALDMARLALRTNETPVGCVLVHDGNVIAKGMNATNVTRNGTRHAELMALSALLSFPPKTGHKTKCLKPKQDLRMCDGASDTSSVDSRQPDEGNEDGSKGHLYPYGQKFHPAPRVHRDIIRESILYVTVEPCVMCASLLRQLGIKKVYFGAVNDKFGGTGGVFSIHANSLPVRPDGQTASAHPTPKPTQLPDRSGVLGTSFPPSGGDGGNVEPGYEIEGGWGRDDAVALLRRFYVQENGRAPVPRKKEGRAARLAAMMEKDGNASATSLVLDSALAGEVDDERDLAESTKENIDPETETSKSSRNGEANMHISSVYGD